MKTQSELIKSSNYKFFRFLALSISISILSTSGAIAVEIFQHKDKRYLANWAYVGLGQFMGLGAAAGAFKLVKSDRNTEASAQG
jgi:hypothetical protein